MSKRPKFVAGWDVAEVICKALGIDCRTVSRMVIDLDCEGGPGKIYIQSFTTDALIEYDFKAFCNEADVKIV